jgi:ribA/ribD-fused uncharacterized protein
MARTDARTDTRTDTGTYHFFYSERSPEESCFTNFVKVSYTIDPSDFPDSKYGFMHGIRFSSSEQGFMYGKALIFGDEKNAAKILEAATPREAKDLGKVTKGFTHKLWNPHKVEIMYENCYSKFKTNKKMRKKLLATGNSILVEASGRDDIWGIGINMKNALISDPDKWGLNLLGKVLMRVRDRLLRAIDAKADFSEHDASASLHAKP